MKILPAQLRDAPVLSDLFFAHLDADPSYISHGEMQMGVGTGRFTEDGTLVSAVAQDGRKKWMRYIRFHLTSPEEAAVWKAVDDAGNIVGFCVADIEEDGDAPFGMVCDVLVSPTFRGGGAGGALLATAVAWLRGKGVRDIYLESGKDNHAAHRFFEKRGFRHVSDIFKLDNAFPR